MQVSALGVLLGESVFQATNFRCVPRGTWPLLWFLFLGRRIGPVSPRADICACPCCCRAGCRLAAEAAVKAWPERSGRVQEAKTAAKVAVAVAAAAEAEEGEESAPGAAA